MRPHNIFTEKNNLIAIYTALSILIKLKEEMGLEAMLEYMEKYRRVLERDNPGIKEAVWRALQMMSMEKIYNEVSGPKQI